MNVMILKTSLMIKSTITHLLLSLMPQVRPIPIILHPHYSPLYPLHTTRFHCSSYRSSKPYYSEHTVISSFDCMMGLRLSMWWRTATMTQWHHEMSLPTNWLELAVHDVHTGKMQGNGLRWRCTTLVCKLNWGLPIFVHRWSDVNCYKISSKVLFQPKNYYWSKTDTYRE